MEDNSKENILVTIIIVLGLIIVVNQVLIFNMSGRIVQVTGTSETTQRQTVDVIPKGVPRIYGEEIGVSYDDVSASDSRKTDQTIYKLAFYDRNITLDGTDLERYIDITSQISCEYCCGAQSIIFSDGRAACGCAHSYAMRGLAKYLITNHPDEFTDDEILEELGKWKTLFFPQQISLKASVLKDNGIELNYISLTSNKYRDIEAGATGGMVGGC